MSPIVFILELIFFLSLLGVLHTYLLYPVFMNVAGYLIPGKKPLEKKPQEYPTVDVVFAAYNEEAVIREKLASIYNTSYPFEKIRVRVGSDASTDRTDAIVREFQKKQPGLLFKRFERRTGKARILNDLVSQSEADYLLFTDANIIFQRETIKELVGTLSDQKTGIAGGTLVYTDSASRGISSQENKYLRLENRLKEVESRLFGCAMGAEGGCYLMRRALFPGIPDRYYMEDFYITMYVLKKGFKVRLVPEAEVFEDISVDSSEEYKRKVRISIGNFQNLKSFGSLVWSSFFPVGFVFLSHKILRWLTPILLLVMLMCVMFLVPVHPFFALFAGLYMAFIGLGLFGILFSGKQKAGWLKYPGHFIHMNLALLEGFFIFIKGVESNVWQPTKRNQD